MRVRISNFIEKVGKRGKNQKNKQEVRFPKLTYKAAWAKGIIPNFPYSNDTQRFHAPV